MQQRRQHGRDWLTSGAMRARLLAATLTLWTLACTGCSPQPRAPTVIGQRRVVAVNPQAGTVTITMSLWIDIVRRLKACSDRSTI